MKAEGLAEATRRNCYTTLRVAVDDAVINGLLATNPVHRVRQPKVTRHEHGSCDPRRSPLSSAPQRR
jgi:integrase